MCRLPISAACLCMFFLLSSVGALAQSPLRHPLKPGFDPEEFVRAFVCNYYYKDSGRDLFPPSAQYKREYRSAVMGLDNQWDMWDAGFEYAPVISLRGTTRNPVSWVENFYSAMIPAIGKLDTGGSAAPSFTYRLAGDSAAMVHVGWTLALSYIGPDVLRHIHEKYAAGHREFIIVGHSQGGALAYLLRSWLHYESMQGRAPADMLFKVYTSAAPKPGNTYYAYDYENLTAGGWSWQIVNAADWVPETPVSVQTVNDLNYINPFSDASKLWQGQPFYIRWFLNSKYKKLKKRGFRARDTYNTYFGRMLFKRVSKEKKSMLEPEYALSNHYVRCGYPVALIPDAAYFKKFPNDKSQLFIHHGREAYYFLLARKFNLPQKH